MGLTFDLLISKYVRGIIARSATILPIFDFLGLSVLELTIKTMCYQKVQKVFSLCQ